MNKFGRIVGIAILCWGVVDLLPVYAYIDPGTGSMLFSVVLGCSATLFFIFSSVYIKLKQIFFAKNDLCKNNIPFVIYSEGNQYFTLFKPILDEFEKRKIPLHYYTSEEIDRIFETDYKYIKTEYIGKQNKAFFKLAFLKADICLMTVPQLDVLQLKRSKFVKHYSHIFHSITFSMHYRLFSLDYYDSVLCDGEFQIPMIREIEQKRNLPQKELVVTGCPYMDYLQNEKQKLNISEHPYTILLAPSWGSESMLNKFGSKLIRELLKTGYNIIIRPHPQSWRVETDLLKKLQNEFKEYTNISWNKDSDNLKVLAMSDILISDFSSVMFDWAFLFNKPFIYSNSDMNKEIYDMSELDEEPKRYEIMRKIGKELTKENLGDIKNLIENLKDNEEIQSEIEKAKAETWMFQGSAAKNVADFLIKKQKELNS